MAASLTSSEIDGKIMTMMMIISAQIVYKCKFRMEFQNS